MNKLYVIAFFLIISCKTDKTVKEIPFDFDNNNGQPSLVSSEKKLSLSWVSKNDNNDATLKFTQYINNQWSKPMSLAKGSNWFINWADFPTHSINDDLVLSSHLQKSGDGTYEYDIILNLNKINGETVRSNFKLNKEGVKAEHGFVSIKNDKKGGFFLTWLDGRNTIFKDMDGNHKPMTIRFAQVTQNGEIVNDRELDAMTCECCQTSITDSPEGPIVVYRDRSEDEIRDIYITKSILGEWDEPKAVNNDNWKINGCPVNGPKVISNLNKLAVAWFTISKGIPTVNVALSDDLGSTFNNPIKLNDFDPVGRVDIDFLNNDQVIVSYIENDSNGSYLRLKKVDFNGSISKHFTVDNISGERNSGVPQLEIVGNEVFVVWTISKNGKSHLKSVKIDSNLI